MQQDSIDIENKLRQLENQQLPDLSQMDAHWAGMKAALQPAAVKGSSSKWFWLTGLFLFIGAGTLIFISSNNKTEENRSVTEQTNTVTITKSVLEAQDSATDLTIPASKTLLSNTAVLPVVAKVVKNKKQQNETGKQEVNLSVKLDTKDSTLKTTSPDAQKILNQLLASLAKDAEEFIIDNSRDTILFASEGSSLYIPAKSLGGSNKIKISLKEFYKTSDIVLNKLSTTSNGEQLVTGGMIHISASVNDKRVNILPGKSIKWYLPDTSKQMEQMELFKGEEKKNGVNWLSTGKMFNWPYNFTEVRVLDLSNEPFRVIKKSKGDIGVFLMSYESKLSKTELKSILKEKYGYHKVRIKKRRFGLRDIFLNRSINKSKNSFRSLGDSAWIKKDLADKYELQSTQTRIMQGSLWGNLWGGSILNRGSRQAKVKRQANVDTLSYGRLDMTGVRYTDSITNSDQIAAFQNGLNKLQEKYSVDINTLGWINCDRFCNDSREKVNYYVNLQDSAINYYTMIVFNKLRSIMAGYVTANNVQFSNVPVGEAVKIISIGVDKKGEVVMAMKETKISKETFAGLQFESTSANTIKSTLLKEDNNR